jgi:molybdopterin converting factor subunit 1
MANIRVLFFASLADHFGHQPVALALPSPISASRLRELLAADKPGAAAALAGARIAVNRSFVPDTTVLKSGDEIAFIPPVSGG